MTTITNIPSFEIVQGWNVADVKNFLESNKVYFSLNDSEINKIENEGYHGKALLLVTKEDFLQMGLRRAPATTIAEFVAQINDQRLLSLEEYLSCAPPYIAYSPYGTISTSSTNAVGNPPDKVMIWKDFLASVNNYTFDQEKKYAKPNFIKDFIPTNEEVVRRAMDVNICIPLNMIGSNFVFATRNVPGTGDPDFVCHKKDGDELILAIEIKRVHILNHIESDQTLPKVYEEDAKVKQVIQQLYNYLSENQLKYGALSTYDHSWFVKRDHRYLYISESLEYNSTHPPVLKTYAYLAQQAIDNGHNSPHANIIPQTDDSQHNLRKRRYDPSSKQPSPGKSQRPSSSSKGSSSSTSGKTSGKQAQSFEYGDFKYMSILSVGENKKVLECEFHGKPIVLKCTDLSKKPNCLDELLNEVEMYRVLAKLQGVYIPELLFYGDLANGMSFVMGLSIVGTTLYHHKIDKRQKKRALGALDKIHDYKILHNDIREENILVDEKGYVYLTDFGMSIRNDDKELFSKEKCELSRLLDCYM